MREWAQRNWNNERLIDQSDEVIKELEESSVEIAFAEIRNQSGGVNLNPTGSEFHGGWSLWSDGQIIFAKSDGSSVSANQESESSAYTLGLDRPYGANGLFGIAFTFGSDDVDVGSEGSNLESDNYSFSIYSSNRLAKKLPIEAQLGLGKMKMNTKRVEESITHLGNRDVNMIFGSAAIVGESISRGNFKIKPYGRLEAAHINFEEFSESGSHLALTFKEQELNQKMVSVGFDLDYEIPFKRWNLKPFGKIEYDHDLTADSNVDMHYVNDSQTYRLKILKSASSYWTAGIGIELYQNIRNGFSASLSYEREQADASIYSDSYQLHINWLF